RTEEGSKTHRIGDRDQEGLKEIRMAINEGRSARVVLRNYHKDGTMFWNELSLSPVHNEQDQLTYYIGIQKDVTAQVEAEARARVAEEELAALKASL
ncbi:MAG: PAS domain-containing protein, partial [Thalassolituus sp.]